MSKNRPALGRGLDALINPQLKDEISEPVTISSSEIKEDDGLSHDIMAKLPVSGISPNPYQPRTEFDPVALDELKKSILENGLIQPVSVRRVSHGKYELISGERRLRACIDIGYEEIPAYIIKVETKEAMVALSLIENIQREKLNAVEVAQAYNRLLTECNLTQDEIAKRVGKDRSTITNTLRLLKLPGGVLEALARGSINAGHARCLINLPSEAMQLDMLNRIVKGGLSVRKVEHLVKKLFETPKKNGEETDSEENKLESLINRDIETKLQTLIGTKVNCRQKKDGSGQLIIEFYSNDELERLFEMFEAIDKNYN